MTRIHEEERLLSVKKQLIICSTVILASVATLIPVVKLFAQEFIQSGFAQFASLIFTDFGYTMSNWQDFSLSLLEALPTISTIALLSTVLVLLWSAKHFATTIKNFPFPHQLIHN